MDGYLGITADSQLSFKKHVGQVCNTVKFNLRDFRYMRNKLPLDAAKLYMHSMIFSHVSYCITSWSQTGKTTLAPLQTLKVLDKKPLKYHHCKIIQRHNLMTFDSFVFLADVCLVYKIMNDLAATPLNEFVSLRSVNGRRTRKPNRGVCVVQHTSTEFGTSVFSVRATKSWNSVTSEMREWNTFAGLSLR